MQQDDEITTGLGRPNTPREDESRPEQHFNVFDLRTKTGGELLACGFG
jgi:hypothetical protein